jgi:hypothetical protein
MLIPRALLALLCASCTSFAWASGPVLLDFEDAACPQAQAQCDVGDAYLSKGFALRVAPNVDEPDAKGLVSVGKAWRFNLRGSQAMSLSSCGGSVTLMANDNSLFDAVALGLAEMNGQGATVVAFAAAHEDGSVAAYTAKLDGKAGWQRVVLPASFKRLTALSWQQGDCVSNPAHMFDQIELVSHAP